MIKGNSKAGCVIEGSVSVGDPTINVYNISATLTGETCEAPSGKRYDYLAFLISSPTQQIIGIANLDGRQGALFGDRISTPP
jgi:hypothetical protein